MKQVRILLVEDEEAIRDMIKFAFATTDFDVTEASTVKEAKEKIAVAPPHLILLDWMLSGISGIDFIKQLKKNQHTQHIPIIMLTARAEEEHKITGLELGADDYVTKPFSPRELVARIKTVLRRGSLVTPEGIIQVKQLLLNINTHQVTINEKVVSFTAIEYKLLHFFLTHQEQIYSREQLLQQIWSKDSDIYERTVDVHIRRLRSRLEPYGYDKHIKTVHSHGYQFVGEPV